MTATKSSINYLMKKYDIVAKKKYGQNFLCEPTIINKVCDQLEKDDSVLEIGTGLGSLTLSLAQTCKQVKGYEIDKELYEILKNEAVEYKNLELVNEDFLKTDLNTIEGKVVVVSNLPYYITTELLIKLFSNHSKITKIIAMMQKEVAERFIKKDKGKDYNLLQVMAEYYSNVSILTKVNRNNFIPSPNVDSTILVFQIKEEKLVDDEEKFWEMVKACFSQRRKTVLSNLTSQGYNITKEDLVSLSLEATIRVEQLSLSDFIKIYEVVR